MVNKQYSNFSTNAVAIKNYKLKAEKKVGEASSA
jgi:hypothetical protein